MTRDSRPNGRTDWNRRDLLKTLPLAGLAVAGTGSAAARGGPRFPDLIPLPDGFQPEGIVSGRGTEFFVGSLADGSVYRGDYRTGEGEVLVDGADRVAVGLSYDRRSDRLFVAGEGTGKAFVYDARTGETAGVYDLTDPGPDPSDPETFVNDVVVTREAAYFTDSAKPSVYRLPLGPGGRLPDTGDATTLELGDDFEFVPGGFNANGIDATPDGEYLLVVNTTTGLLYRVDPATGEASEVDLGGATLANGDGILLDGTTLYVVQNFQNQIAVVELDAAATSCEVVGTITDPDFDVPTTVAEFGGALYAVNARFGIPDADTASYDVVRVSK
jgi:sugar lactone lactonase YvrE